MTAKDQARSRIAAAADQLIELSHRIHAHPETAWAEHRAAGWLTDALDRLGYAVTRDACQLPTAFTASIGTGELHIGICAEYDALPGLGHACGHNIIAAAALGAATGLAGLADQLGLTVTVLGTPAGLANARDRGRPFTGPGAGARMNRASTDMGNISLRLPAIHPYLGIDSLPAVNHQPEFAAHCAGPAADRAVLDGAALLAATVIDAATRDNVRDRLLHSLLTAR